MKDGRRGPLSDLGPATLWCFLAGLVSGFDAPPTPGQFEKEIDVILREGLAPTSARALAGLPGYADEPGYKLFKGKAFQAQLQSMAVDGAGASLLASLAEHHILATVIKGPAAARFYPEGWPRPYADLDIVVRRSDFNSVVSLAKQQGFANSKRAVPQWDWFDLICREGANLHTPQGGNVDVHHHLAPWTIGSRLKPEDLNRRSHNVSLCGIPADYAAPADLLIASALHIVNDLWKGKAGLVSWRDVILLLRSLGESEARDAFDRVQLGWLLDVILQELETTVPQVGLQAPVSPTNLSSVTQAQLSLLGWWNDSSIARHRLAWATRLPPGNALAFLAGTAVPSPHYIHTRHGTYRAYWKRSAQETVSTAHGSDFRMTTIDDHEVS
jgi:hypothetical protein